MGVKNYKPTSPGRRDMSVSDFAEVTKSAPERSLVEGRVNKSGGRNGHGRTTSWHRGGGHKRNDDEKGKGVFHSAQQFLLRQTR